MRIRRLVLVGVLLWALAFLFITWHKSTAVAVVGPATSIVPPAFDRQVGGYQFVDETNGTMAIHRAPRAPLLAPGGVVDPAASFGSHVVAKKLDVKRESGSWTAERHFGAKRASRERIKHETARQAEAAEFKKQAG